MEVWGFRRGRVGTAVFETAGATRLDLAQRTPCTRLALDRLAQGGDPEDLLKLERQV